LELEAIHKKVQETKKLPPEEKDYFSLYVHLEHELVDVQKKYSVEELRDLLESKYNLQIFPKEFAILLSVRESDEVVFLLIFTKKLLQALGGKIKISELQRIVNEITKGEITEGIVVEKDLVNMIDLENSLLSIPKEYHVLVIKNLNELIEALHKLTANNFGESQTHKIFSDVFNELKKKYTDIPGFIQAVRELPIGILEEEKFSFLTKEELEKTSKKLARIDIMKSEFTNIAAHELKTPIIPLKGFLRRMKKYPKKYGLNKMAKEHVNICVRNVERLENLVGDILDISKLEAGEMKFEMENVNLVPLLHNVITDLSSLAKEKNMILKTKIPKTLPLVYGDPKRLTQVLSNLINNAIKFTNKGDITVNTKLVGSNIQVDVIDTGMGISKENIPKLFTKFFQTQEAATRTTKGTGLGLAICKEIITAHHGKIWAESEGLGRGSTFSFTMPIKPREKKRKK